MSESLLSLILKESFSYLLLTVCIIYIKFVLESYIYHKGNQPWIFIGRTGAEAEAPILWSPDVKKGHIWKDPETGKDWGQEVTEREMVGWCHQLNEHELEHIQRVGHNWATSLSF